MRKQQARRDKRKPFDIVGLLDFGDNEDPRPCQIIDISDSGARLTVFMLIEEVPEQFMLLLSPSAKVRRCCKVVWRSDAALGVKFLKGA